MAPVDSETVEKLAEVSETVDLRARELGDEEQSGKVAIVIADGSRAFLIHFVPDDPNVHSGKDIGVFTDQEAMVAAIQAIVEPHWDSASTYERRRVEIAEGREPEFTRVYASAADATPAVEAALARGAKEALMVDAGELRGSASTPRLWGARLPTTSIRWRALLNLRDVAASDAHLAKSRRDPRMMLRHLRTPAVSSLVIDGREAFFTVGDARSNDGSEIVVHTNSPSIVRRAQGHFERLWAIGMDPEDRRRELEIFPHLQPGDVGIGRLFDLLRDAVFVIDERGEIVLSNPSSTAIFGLTPEQARGRQVAELVDGSESKGFLDRLAEFRKRAQSERDSEFFETQGLRPGGASFPMEVTLSILPTPESGQYVLAVAHDISSRRDAQGRVQRAYERMTEAFYALDNDWRFVYRNPTVRAMQRTRVDAEIDGKVIWEAFPELIGTQLETQFRRAKREMRPVTFTEHYPRFGRSYEITAYPGEDGLSIYFRDVAEAGSE